MFHPVTTEFDRIKKDAKNYVDPYVFMDSLSKFTKKDSVIILRLKKSQNLWQILH